VQRPLCLYLWVLLPSLVLPVDHQEVQLIQLQLVVVRSLWHCQAWRGCFGSCQSGAAQEVLHPPVPHHLLLPQHHKQQAAGQAAPPAPACSSRERSGAHLHSVHSYHVQTPLWVQAAVACIARWRMPAGAVAGLVARRRGM
jgi:hypothetical protein